MKKIRKITLLILCIFMIFIIPITTFASPINTFKSINAEGTLWSTEASSLKLPIKINKNNILGISLIDNKGKMIASNFEINNELLTITPKKDLVGEKQYSIRIFTKDDNKYEIKMTAKDKIDINVNEKSIIKVSAKPDKGFNYPYYLLIPKGTFSNTGSKYLVVEPNNTGKVSDYLKVHDIAVKIHLHDYGYITGGAGGYQVATELKMPLLVPVFPRPTTEDGAGIYTHALDREAMTVTGVDYERVDLQLIAMINDAKELLKEQGIELEEKIFMVGFSASGDFINRFMFLHPEIVKAIASSTSSIFPAKEYQGVTLNYPLGIADIEKFTGKPFNAEAYNKVAKYIYTGDGDRNDITIDWDKNGEWYVKAMKTLFGEERFPDKWYKKIDIINKLGYGDNYQYHIYKGIGHNISDNMYEDVVKFFKANMNDEFIKITPHENAY